MLYNISSLGIIAYYDFPSFCQVNLRNILRNMIKMIIYRDILYGK